MTVREDVGSYLDCFANRPLDCEAAIVDLRVDMLDRDTPALVFSNGGSGFDAARGQRLIWNDTHFALGCSKLLPDQWMRSEEAWELRSRALGVDEWNTISTIRPSITSRFRVNVM